MKRPLLSLSLVLVSVPAIAQDFESFPPGREASTPTYVNAEVVRVSGDGTATIRSESGDVSLTADLRAVAGLVGVRAGDKLLVAFETGFDPAGRERRIVTYARPASPGSGEAGPAFASAGTNAPAVTPVRVISHDRAGRTVTVTDTSGVPLTLSLSARAASALGTVRPGDVVGLDFVSGGVVSANALPVVSGFQPLPAGTAVGPFTGTGQVARTTDTGRFGRTTLAPGVGRGTFNDMGMNAGVTGVANVGGAVGVTNAQAARMSTAQAVGGVNNTQSVGTFNNQNLAGLDNAGVNRAGINAGGFSPVGGIPVGATGAGSAPVGAAGGGTFNNMGAGLPFLGGGFATPSVGPGSPYSSNVPSVPAPGVMTSAVLPPATAKAPLTQEDVGALRAYGEHDLDAAAMVLATVANDIDAAWFRYKVACMGGFTAETTPGREWFLLLEGRVRTPTDDQCRAMYAQLQGMAAGFDIQLGITLDAARRADVLPGRVREIMARHRLER